MNNKVKLVVATIVLAVIALFLPIALASNVALAIGIFIGGFTGLVLAKSPVRTISSSISSSSSPAPSNNKPKSDFKGETKTLYVGNLPYRANEAAVRELFSQQGIVVSVRLMRDRNTGKRKGFGFVEMAANDAVKAIEALNDAEFQQRTLKVREAKDRPAPEKTDANSEE